MGDGRPPFEILWKSDLSSGYIRREGSLADTINTEKLQAKTNQFPEKQKTNRHVPTRRVSPDVERRCA
jgi:hypothetical protein